MICGGILCLDGLLDVIEEYMALLPHGFASGPRGEDWKECREAELNAGERVWRFGCTARTTLWGGGILRVGTRGQREEALK